MDPLRQPQAQKVIYETRPTSQINDKAEYPWREGNALYLVGSEGVLYYELLKPGETINGERYRTQLIHLKRTISEKRPEYATRHEAIIFHHDNAVGPMLLFRLRTIWKTVDGKFYPTLLIAQTLPLLTTIRSGRCRTSSLEYGSHQNRISKIGSIHSWPSSRRSSFGMESTNFQKDGKKS